MEICSNGSGSRLLDSIYFFARKTFFDNGAENAEAIRDGAEVGDAVDTFCFIARHLGNVEARFKNADVHQGFDFKPIGVDVEDGENAFPEGVVTVAEVRVVATEAHTNEHHESPVA